MICDINRGLYNAKFLNVQFTITMYITIKPRKKPTTCKERRLYFGQILCLEIFTPVICISRNEMRQKKQYSSRKVSFSYFVTNIKCSIFRNLGPLTSVKDVKTLEEGHYFSKVIKSITPPRVLFTFNKETNVPK